MNIKNLTDKVLEIILEGKLKDSRTYTIYLEPFSSTDIEGHLSIANIEDIRGSIEIEGCHCTVPTCCEVDTQEENSYEEIIQEEITQEEILEESTTEDDKFICDICGAEFGSARGLSSHKARVHSEEEK